MICVGISILSLLLPTMCNVLPVALVVIILPSPMTSADEPQPNTLTDKEKAEGWKLLFDGKTARGWHAFGGGEVPDRWKIIGGTLVVSPKNGQDGGDIVTDADYDNFELILEWRVTEGANSGVMYHVSESERAPFFTGP